MCAMKYFIEYVLGHTGKSNKKADKGTVFHKVMEIIANVKYTRQNSPKKKTFKDDIIGSVKIPEDLSKLDVNSIYDKVYNYYSTNFSHHVWSNKDDAECREWVYCGLNKYNSYFDPRNQKIVKAEQHFDIELTNDWAKYNYEKYNLSGYLKLMGTIDLITDIGDMYEIVDYKTGACKNWATEERYTHENLHHNFQLRFYHMVCSMLFPDKDYFSVVILYLNDGGPLTMTLGREDLPYTMELIRSKYEEIRDTKYPELNKTWKCTAFCDCGKTTFEDTNVKPLIATERTNFSKIGDNMTKCDQVNYALKYRDIGTVIDNMSKEGHHMGHYKKPGDVS
jgi:hypothetical protein